VRPGKTWVRGHHSRKWHSLEDQLERRVKRPGEGCWIAEGKPDWAGYVRLWRAGKGRGAHVLAWEAASGEPVPEGMDVCHTCDTPTCCRNDGPEGTYEVEGVLYKRFGHLWLGTAQANSMDKVLKGRHGAWTQPDRVPRGEEHWTRRRKAQGLPVLTGFAVTKKK
jgi:hypothetical protein